MSLRTIALWILCCFYLCQVSDPKVVASASVAAAAATTILTKHPSPVPVVPGTPAAAPKVKASAPTTARAPPPSTAPIVKAPPIDAHWMPKDVRAASPVCTLYVLTFDRPRSLLRLLQSLINADYLGHRVDLVISVDHPRLVSDLVPSDDYMDTLELARAFVSDGPYEFEYWNNSSLRWPHGEARAIFHTRNRGIVRQWLDTFKPKYDDECGILLEDDLEVSRHYYKWLTLMREKYLCLPNLAGFSFQRQGLVPDLKSPRRKTGMVVNNGNNPFMYKLVGSWGYSPSARAWRQFRSWFHTQSPTFQPIIPNMITTSWFQSVGHMWTQYHIYFCDKHDLYTIYPNMPKKHTLCANWREAGLHYSDKNKPVRSSLLDASPEIYFVGLPLG